MSVENEAPGARRDEGLLTAANLLVWRYAEAKLPLPRLPEAALLTHQPSLLRRRRIWRRNRALAHLSFDADVLDEGGREVLLACCRGAGAPVTAAVIEEMAALGVRRLVAVDVAASLDARARTGDPVLVEAALACDGTSPHYTRDALARPSRALFERLAAAFAERGAPYAKDTVWTTDAVYRETEASAAVARQRGAVLVDMETAATFAVAGALGIEAAAVLVVADHLSSAWRPPSEMRLVRESLLRAKAIAVSCLTA